MKKIGKKIVVENKNLYIVRKLAGREKNKYKKRTEDKDSFIWSSCILTNIKGEVFLLIGKIKNKINKKDYEKNNNN